MTFIERYLLAVDKCYVQCLNDPETQPYKSKYEARKIFEDLREENIDEESDTMKKEFETLDIISDDDKLQFIIRKSDEQLNELSGE